MELYETDKKAFLEDAVALLDNRLFNLGVALPNPERLQDVILAIGEKYHASAKKAAF